MGAAVSTYAKLDDFICEELYIYSKTGVYGNIIAVDFFELVLFILFCSFKFVCFFAFIKRSAFICNSVFA